MKLVFLEIGHDLIFGLKKSKEILKNTPPPPKGQGNISRCHLGKKYEKGKRKNEKM
jgi:hypothetical protein